MNQLPTVANYHPWSQFWPGTTPQRQPANYMHTIRNMPSNRRNVSQQRDERPRSRSTIPAAAPTVIHSTDITETATAERSAPISKTPVETIAPKKPGMALPERPAPDRPAVDPVDVPRFDDLKMPTPLSSPILPSKQRQKHSSANDILPQPAPNNTRPEDFLEMSPNRIHPT